MPATETFRIPKHRRHVPTARRQVRKALANRGVTDQLADSVTLLANELVTNAVTHCRTSCAQVEVKLSLHEAQLMLEVSDPDRDRLPRLHDSAPDEEGGRGLVLVAALADEWGCWQGPYTKCVWALFALGEAESARTPSTL
ncbi:ATP-binding protein [Streptomyces sp. M2CJ-2]|uniref:ATP-binding protein n=1 Tax=Streptomyces sp. M2CJ-2 TaxID=2803948 RepID=UPI0019295ECD|nr:ATP-binding protein [Streptomyces sp. M2CJ-2]MBL3667501.1 ATP-binding protein [Streptomyces sp. M2CJ-2]